MTRPDARLPRGLWHASILRNDTWTPARPLTGPYAKATLLEWGSITKGVVATTAALTLDLATPVRDYLPRFPAATFTVGSLITHTSGLPRMPAGSAPSPFADPYTPRRALPLTAAIVCPVSPAGSFLYSNLGYAVLGAVLDEAHGHWLDAARRHVLAPAGISRATLTPPSTERVLPRTWRGRPVEPWSISTSPYAAAGGLWASFHDLCRYASWALVDPMRLGAWQSSEGARWINGALRSSGTAIVAEHGGVAVAHVLERPPGTADRLALELLS